jgi:exosome complex exonuclease RRP6
MDIYDGENGLNSSGWVNVIKKCREPLNEISFALFKRLHEWRDIIARKEDESHRFVLSNHFLFTLSRVMPM